MGQLCRCTESAVSSSFHPLKMKAFVAVIASLAASAKGEAQIFANGYANGVYGYAGYPGYAYNGLTYAAPATVAAAPVATFAHHAVAAPALAYAHHPYAVVNPYDYAGQVYPAAEPYIHDATGDAADASSPAAEVYV